MSPSSPVPRFAPARSALAAFVLFTLLSLVPRAAWAKFVPPPKPDGHTVTMVGWLSPSDVRKIDEECETARTQTGFVIDILLATNDASIDEVTDATYKAWAPGDPKKQNGILLVVQPNWPRGERKARLQVGQGAKRLLDETKATNILRVGMGPRMNATSDEVRAAVAGAVVEIAKAVGTDVSVLTPFDPNADAGAADAGNAAVPAGSAATAPEADKPGKAGAPNDDPGSTLLTALFGFLAIVVAYVGFMWFRGSRKSS